MQTTRPTTLVRRWGEMVKFSHSVFALPFAVMAAFLASRSAWQAGRAERPWPDAITLGLILVCMISARSVAMTFNRIVDAALDALNPRTAGRAIPAGQITTRQATLFAIVFTAIFVVACAGLWWWRGNPWPMLLAGPVLGYLCFYSYTKRFTRWSHLVLGSAIALSPPAAWLAVDPASLGVPALLLMGAVTLWIGGFDVIYACQDVDADRRAGLHSLPARIGMGPALWIARLAHFGTVLLLVLLGLSVDLFLLYWVGVALVALLLIVENVLVQADDLSRINVAFFTVNGVISLTLAALTLADIFVFRTSR